MFMKIFLLEFTSNEFSGVNDNVNLNEINNLRTRFLQIVVHLQDRTKYNNYNYHTT